MTKSCKNVKATIERIDREVLTLSSEKTRSCKTR